MDNLESFINEAGIRFPSQRVAISTLQRKLRAGDDITSRKCFPIHLTASACIFDKSLKHVLMIWSPKFNNWLLPGGHIDPGESPLEAARREAAEECGIPIGSIKSIADYGQPISIGAHWINESLKKAEPRHRHCDLRFAFQCDNVNIAQLRFDPGEVEKIAWRPISATYVRYRGIANIFSEVSQ